MLKRGTRGSEWLSVRRSLAILHRLTRGPASSVELIAAVQQTVGQEAYPASPSAARAAFKHDRDNLRHQLGADWRFDHSSGEYSLIDPGPFGWLELSPRGLGALRLLAHTFMGELGDLASVQELLDDLIGRLSPQARLTLESGSDPVELDFLQNIEVDPPRTLVQELVTRAVQSQRKLGFNYLSPQISDELPRYHVVAPQRLRFRRGHWYLYAYGLTVREPDGTVQMDGIHRRFRLSRVQDDGQLALFPGKSSPVRPAPRFLVRYRLLGPLSRSPVSRHFEAMQVSRQPDGSLIVEGYTYDDWEAAQLLLSYGENCLVLGGVEVLERVITAVRGMGKNYGIDE